MPQKWTKLFFDFFGVKKIPFFLGSLGTGMKQISVIGKEVENKNGQQPCKLLVTSFDTNDLDLQPPPPFPEKRPKSTTASQRPTSFLENIKVRFNFVLF